MIFFHVSKQKFDWPDIDAIEEFILKNEKSVNGTLGLWISTNPAACRGFGEEVAEIKLCDDAVHVKLPISDLKLYVNGALDSNSQITPRSPGFDIDAYDRQLVALHKELGREYSKHADVLYIEDASPFAGEVIILNFDAIESIRWHDNFDFDNPEIAQYRMSKIPFDTEAQEKIDNIRLLNMEVVNKNFTAKMNPR